MKKSILLFVIGATTLAAGLVGCKTKECENPTGFSGTFNGTHKVFIGTAVVVSTFVDFTRLSVYATRFNKTGLSDNLILVVCATLAAIAGAYIGNKLLKKVTLRFLQVTIAIMLIIISLALGAGLI